ncbi:MAG: hypothetical protein WAV70_02115 [Anaerolineae bacterium]
MIDLRPIQGVLLVWPFLFDAVFTFLFRLRHRENVFAAHRSHLYHRLVIAGYSHRTVTLLYIGLAAVEADAPAAGVRWLRVRRRRRGRGTVS